MKGNAFKASYPSSRRKEKPKNETFPKTYRKMKMTDLSFPIFKLESRAEYERECLEHKTQSSGSSSGGFIETEITPEQRQATLDRAEACERAVAILKAAQ